VSGIVKNDVFQMNEKEEGRRKKEEVRAEVRNRN
jgi:hypothetical protein